MKYYRPLKSKMYYLDTFSREVNYQRLMEFIAVSHLLQAASFISAAGSLFPEPNSDLSVLDDD